MQVSAASGHGEGRGEGCTPSSLSFESGHHLQTCDFLRLSHLVTRRQFSLVNISPKMVSKISPSRFPFPTFRFYFNNQPNDLTISFFPLSGNPVERGARLESQSPQRYASLPHKTASRPHHRHPILCQRVVGSESTLNPATVVPYGHG